MQQIPNNHPPSGGLLDMVQQLIPGYSGKEVDDRLARELQRAGVEEPINAQVPPEVTPPTPEGGLLQLLQQLLQQQQQ